MRRQKRSKGKETGKSTGSAARKTICGEQKITLSISVYRGKRQGGWSDSSDLVLSVLPSQTVLSVKALVDHKIVAGTGSHSKSHLHAGRRKRYRLFWRGIPLLDERKLQQHAISMNVVLQAIEDYECCPVRGPLCKMCYDQLEDGRHGGKDRLRTFTSAVPKKKGQYSFSNFLTSTSSTK